MEIIKYKKIKNNLYELTLDNGSILKLYDETIMKFLPNLQKKINHQLLEEITKFNDDLSSYYLSLAYLNKKMRSELEIEKYLTKKEFNKNVIDKTITKLKQDGYLNNQRFIESYINDEFNLTNNGPEKIKHSLIKLGIKEEEINIDRDFDEKIQNLINKKIKLNHKLNTNSLKMNLTNYLINLGYPKDMFTYYLENIKVRDEDLILKDYESLLKKYSKKYDKYKLKLFIKDKLYKKGYNIEEINGVINDEE